MTPTILGNQVHPTLYHSATAQIAEWAKNNRSRYVCAANVHGVMEAWDDPGFRDVLNAADLVTPDGMPLVWTLRLKGYKAQERVYGPTLMLHTLEMAAAEGIPVGFYGGRPEILEVLIKNMKKKYPGLNVVYAHSPPFRQLTPGEDIGICQEIQDSGLRILYVGLGCPKQERWMADHKNRIQAVMLGVGAAFDFHAGAVSQAPPWMQKNGLEWLYRLTQEPGRLWKRYLWNNPRFVVLSLFDFMGLLKFEE